jgi:PAS domain S-box-containing protein
MVKKKTPQIDGAELRRRAEVLLGKETGTGPLGTEEEPLKLRHELQVHQVELEMQNAELRLARDELESALEQYTDLYDFAPSGYFTLDREGTINRVNFTAAGLIGLERSRLVGRCFLLFVAHHDRPAFAAFLGSIFVSPAKETCEVALLKEGHSPLFVQIEAVAATSGRECRIAVIDITEDKLARKSIREVDEIAKEALRKVGKSVDLALTKVEEAAEKALLKAEGITDSAQKKEEALVVERLKVEDAAKAARSMVDKATELARLKVAEAAHALQLDKETTENALQKVYDAVEIAQLKVEKAAEVARRMVLAAAEINLLRQKKDLAESDLKQAEKSSRKSEEALKRSESTMAAAQAISHLGSWHMVNDGEKKEQWSGSEELYRIYGYPRSKQLTMQACIESAHPRDKKFAKASWVAALGGSGPSEWEHRIVVAGQIKWVHARVQIFQDPEGNLREATGIIQDITTRKQAEDDLRSYARRLIEMEENLRKKLALELHDEIGQDLAVLGINMTLMRKKLTNKTAKEIRLRIEDSEKLIDGVRRTTRSIMGNLRPTGLDDLDLVAALTHHVNIFARRTGISVALQVDESFPRLAGDWEIALFRIVQEALTNIGKHAKPRCVNIMLCGNRRAIRLSISDDGCGFLTSSKACNPAGHGMGLKTMRQRAEMIGGSFNLASSPGNGTVVTVLIEDNENAN